MGVGICKSYTEYEVNNQIYKELIHIKNNNKKKKQLNLKMGKGDKQQVLLYSTSNYIQYPVISCNGKEFLKRIYMYVHVN